MNNVVSINAARSRWAQINDDERAARWSQDMADVEAMSSLGLQLLDFLETPPTSCSPKTQIHLTAALGQIKENVDQVRDRWTDLGTTTPDRGSAA